MNTTIELLDARDRFTYNVDKKQNCINPFTAEIIIDGVTLTLEQVTGVTGFKSAQESFEFVTVFDVTAWLSNKVFVVEKQSDFNSGNGHYKFHNVYKNIRDAHDYIMRQSGIYGGDQYHQITYGCTIYSLLYSSNSYNGYRLTTVELI